MNGTIPTLSLFDREASIVSCELREKREKEIFLSHRVNREKDFFCHPILRSSVQAPEGSQRFKIKAIVSSEAFIPGEPIKLSHRAKREKEKCCYSFS